MGHKIGYIARELLKLGVDVYVLAVAEYAGDEKVLPSLPSSGIKVSNEHGIFVARDYRWKTAQINGENDEQSFIRHKANALKYARFWINSIGRPDLIHAFANRYAGIVSAEISEELSIPFVLSEHMSIYSRGLVPQWQMRYLNYVPLFADRLYAVSANLAASLGRKFPSKVSWSVIPNPVDPLLLEHPISCNTIQSHTPVFFNSGQLIPIKGHECLLLAFHGVLQTESSALLRIAGDGIEREGLARKAELLGIENQVEFLGRLPHSCIATELNFCTVYVQSSKYETFGVPLIEAMAMGKFIVATDAGATTEILKPEWSQIVPTDSPEMLSRALNISLRKAEELDPHPVRDFIALKYSPGAIAVRYLKSYQELI
jgi:glycosyltransferase involved in cell wall biosynthesis